MAKLSFTLLLIVATMSAPKMLIAQEGLPMSQKDGRIFYEVIGDSIDATKSQLFAAAKKWFSDAFVSAKSVIQSDDETTGQIIGEAFLTANNLWTDPGFIMTQLELQFSIRIDCRDSKYRIRFYDFMDYTPPSTYIGATRIPLESYVAGITKPSRRGKIMDVLKNADQQVINLIYSFDKAARAIKYDDF